MTMAITLLIGLVVTESLILFILGNSLTTIKFMAITGILYIHAFFVVFSGAIDYLGLSGFIKFTFGLAFLLYAIMFEKI